MICGGGRHGNLFIFGTFLDTHDKEANLFYYL